MTPDEAQRQIERLREERAGWKSYAKRYQILTASLRDENAKLRELVSEYITVADNLCRDGFHCIPSTRCRYYHEYGGKFYCKPGELKQKAESLGIEVPDGRA